MTQYDGPIPEGFEATSVGDLAAKMATTAAQVAACKDERTATEALLLMADSVRGVVWGNSPDTIHSIVVSLLLVAADGFNTLARHTGVAVESLVGASAAAVEAQIPPCTCNECEASRG